MRCTSSHPPAPFTRSRSAATTRWPMEIGGTKWPSMTSTWITRAPARITWSTCSPRRAKSAARMDGRTRVSWIGSCATEGRTLARGGAAPRPAASRPGAARLWPSLLLLPVLARRLGGVLRLVLNLAQLGQVLALDLIAVDIHRVELVGDHPIEVGTAVHLIHFAVAHAEQVAAAVTEHLVAHGVPNGSHVRPRQRPEDVVAPAAVRGVRASVGEDHVAASAAELGVVVLAARHLVAAAPAEEGVVALAALQAIGPTAEEAAAADEVGPTAAEDTVAAATPQELVVALVAGDEVPAGPAVDGVVAAAAVHPVTATAAVQPVGVGAPEDAVRPFALQPRITPFSPKTGMLPPASSTRFLHRRFTTPGFAEATSLRSRGSARVSNSRRSSP